MCRWGAQADSPRCVAYRIPRPASLMQQESAKGRGLQGDALEISTVISAWKPQLSTIPPIETEQESEICSIISTHGSSYLWVTEYTVDVRLDRLGCEEILTTSISYSHMRMTSCNMQLSQWVTIRCWFCRQVKWIFFFLNNRVLMSCAEDQLASLLSGGKKKSMTNERGSPVACWDQRLCV